MLTKVIECAVAAVFTTVLAVLFYITLTKGD